MSGENALIGILSPGAWAQRPLQPRIPNLKVQAIHFVYGDRDWMNPEPVFDLQQDKKNNNGGPELTVNILEGAGHNVSIDNPKGTAAEVAKAIAGKAETLRLDDWAANHGEHPARRWVQRVDRQT